MPATSAGMTPKICFVLIRALCVIENEEAHMARIGFIGLGNMGLPMAANLVKAGHQVAGFDVVRSLAGKLTARGGVAAETAAAACHGADAIITMLPAAEHVRDVYGAPGGVIDAAGAGALLIDSSTIDVGTAREVAARAAGKGLAMVDAPVSGGVAGAAAGTLTFMVGGTDAAFERARPILESMGKTILLAEKLGLDAQRLFDIASKSSGQCWSMTSYCPVPGPVPTSPANRGYQAGFTAAMMLKDLKLAQDAARGANTATPLGAAAAELYGSFTGQGHAGEDFSAIIRFLRGG